MISETSLQERDETSPAFSTTHWSEVLEAGRENSTEAAAALERLCSAYWYPLYAYVRRLGHTPQDAQDLVQDFFARLIEHNYLQLADRNRGRFRTFLLTSLQRFLVNEWKKLRARKRGGGAPVVSWDEEQTENRYLAERTEADTPELLFERRWALALLNQVLARLQAEFVEAGKLQQWDQLKVLLWGEKTARPYAEVAVQMGLTQGALKVAVHRLKKRYRQLLRAEVARTVVSPAEVDEELRHLISVISN
jgi:RNA polymerase sigma-70 factor (ECF subfamily)